MKGISSNLNKEIRNLLLQCGGFESEQRVNTLFTDQRINSWAHDIPQANTPFDRVNNLIAFLHKRFNTHGQNGLVLFLNVLQDTVPKNDSCHPELASISYALELELAKNLSGKSEGMHPSPSSQIGNPHFAQAAKLYDTLKIRFSLKELKELCLYLNIDSDDIEHRSRDELARGIIEFMQRRNNLFGLEEMIVQIRPDIKFN